MSLIVMVINKTERYLLNELSNSIDKTCEKILKCYSKDVEVCFEKPNIEDVQSSSLKHLTLNKEK